VRTIIFRHSSASQTCKRRGSRVSQTLKRRHCCVIQTSKRRRSSAPRSTVGSSLPSPTCAAAPPCGEPCASHQVCRRSDSFGITTAPTPNRRRVRTYFRRNCSGGCRCRALSLCTCSAWSYGVRTVLAPDERACPYAAAMEVPAHQASPVACAARH